MSAPIPESEAPESGPPCAVGLGARFDGLLSFWGAVRVEGRVSGEVIADGTFEVGPEAVVSAHVEVDCLVVEGLVEGSVVARERVEVRAGGRVTAAVRTPRLSVEEGGCLEGPVTMERAAGAAAPKNGGAASAA